MKGTRIWLVALFILYSTANVVKAQADCEIDGISSTVWESQLDIPIKDIDSGVTFKGNTRFIKDMTIGYPPGELNQPNTKYITASFKDNAVEISIAEDFKSYEEYEEKSEFTLNLIFTCQKLTRQLNVVHKIKDTNNHKPIFKPSENFVYEIFTPIKAGVSITKIFGDLIARDVDLTTEKVIFTIEENEYVGISYDSRNGKDFYANLVTKKFITGIDEPITFTIYAQDVDRTGDPPFKETTTVTLKSDPTTQLPITPELENAFYTAKYDGTEVVFDTEIKIVKGHEDSKPSLEGTGSEYFSVSSNNELITISLKPQGIPPEVIESQSYLLFSLVLTKENTPGVKAAIYIAFPEEEIVIPRFEKTLYEGSIDDEGKLTLETLVLEEGYSEDTEYSLVGEHSKYFKFTNDKEKVDIEIKEPIPPEILESESYFSLTLKAVTPKYADATASIVIKLPEKEVLNVAKFEKSLYEGSINDEGKLTLETLLLEDGYTEDTEYSLVGEHSKYFKFTNDKEKVDIEIKEPIPPEILETETYLSLTLKAVTPKYADATALIIIQLPEKEVLNVAKFEKSLYEGSINDEGKLTLETLVLEDGYTEDTVYSLIGDHSKYFKFTNDKEKVDIEIKEPIPPEILESESYLSLTLKAVTPKYADATASIVVKLPEKEVLNVAKFEKSLYEGSINDEGKLTLETLVLEEGYTEDTVYSLVGEHSKYFKFTNDKEKVDIEINEPIPPEILESESYLSLTFKAVTPKHTDATAPIVIKLPEKEVLHVAKFEKSLYEGSINDEGKLTLDTIVLEEGYSEDTEYSLIGEHSKYFKFTNDKEKVDIEIKEPIPPEILESESYLSLTLKAITPKHTDATASIVIKLPEKELLNVANFEKSLYEGKINDEGELNLETLVLKEGYSEDTVYSLVGEHSKYFKFTNDKEKVDIEIKEPIPPEILESETYLSLTLKAVIPKHTDATASIVIKIPEKGVINVAKFEKTLYEGKINNEGELNLETLVLEEGYSEETEYSLDGEHSKYFKFTNDKEKVDIEIKEPIPPEISESSLYISLTLKAKTPKYTDATTSIVITVPNNDGNLVLNFKDPWYKATYDFNDESFTSPTIAMLNEVDENLKLSLSGANAEYFEPVIVGTNIQIKLKQKLPDELKDSVYFLIELRAEKQDYVSAKTIISVELIADNIIPEISFNQASYKGDYFYQNHTFTMSEVIIVDTNTDNEILVSLDGVYKDYFKAQVVNDKIEIDKTKDLPDDESNFITLTLEAKVAGGRGSYAVLVISLHSDDEIPSNTVLQFEFPLYEGSYTEDDKLEIDDIVLKDGYSDSVKFDLSGKYSKYFSYASQSNIIKITLSEKLPSEILVSNSYLVLIMEANSENTNNAMTVININLPKTDLTTVLSFEESIYKGYYLYENNSLTSPQIKLEEGYSEDTEFGLSEDWKEYFDITSKQELVEIILIKNLPEEMLENRVIFIEISATRPKAISAITVLGITLIGEESTENAVRFEHPYYEGIYNDSVLDLEIIKILGDVENTQFKFQNEEYGQYFNIKQTDNNLEITTDGIPNEILDNADHILLILEAKSIGFSDYTTIFINIIKDIEEDIEINFEYEEYRSDITTSTLGEILKIKANSNPSSVVVSYRLEINNDELKSRIQIDQYTGVISVSSFLKADSYEFTAVAENKYYENAKDTSKIYLRVRDVSQIDIELDPLAIINVVEHDEHNKIFNLGAELLNTDCEYTIINSWPDVRSWFYIDYDTGYLASNKEIDREDSLLSADSQMQLELILSCSKRPKATNVFKHVSYESNNNMDRHWIFTNNIAYEPDRRLITILVEDINDHDPEFVGENPSVVGYPSNELVFTIRPPYLTTAKAIDKDIGINAKIQYITYDPYFTIHPETGVVYPKDNALLSLNGDHTMIIFAIDEDGAGRNASMDIQIVPLSPNHISVIKLKNALIEDMENILTTISDQLKISIRALHSVVIPEKMEDRAYPIPRDDMFDYYLNVIIYAMDKDYKLLEAVDINEKLEDVSSWIIETTVLEESIFNGEFTSISDSSNNTGLVVAVSLLGTVLFLAIVGFCIWFFVFLPRTYRRMTESSIASSEATSAESDDTDSRSGDFEETVDKSTQPSQITAATNGETLARSLESIITPEENNRSQKGGFLATVDRKDNKTKSMVTFNETVQQIEVLDDDYEIERL